MQHQVASLVGPLNGSPPVLKGAAVEGPNSIATKGLVSGMVTYPPNGVDVFAQFNGNKAFYEDNVQSFSTVEPAIDLTTSSFLAFSWTIGGLRPAPHKQESVQEADENTIQCASCLNSGS